MRIVEIQLLAFGPFTGCVLDVSGGRFGLHLVYGANEAGKSACMRALNALFYGIPMRTPDNFLHENRKLRIGGRILRASGEELVFVRRKGTKDTLLDGDGKPVADSLLAPYLGGVDQALFGTLFGIDHQGLIAGGQQILAGGGGIGESLFAAGLGTSKVQEVVSSLEKEAASLFLRGGSNPLLNRGIAAYKEARKQVDQASLSGREWAEHDAALQTAVKREEQVRAKLAESSRERNRLERLQRAVSKMALTTG